MALYRCEMVDNLTSEGEYDVEERHLTGVTSTSSMYIDSDREPWLILVYSFDQVLISNNSLTDLTPRMAVLWRRDTTAYSYSRHGKYSPSGLSNNLRFSSGLSEYDYSNSHGSFYFFDIELKTDATPNYWRATLYFPWNGLTGISYDLDIILLYKKEQS